MSDFLSAEEAAHRCGVSSKTVRRWIESGRLKADKVGRSFRIAVSDLDPFIGHSEPGSDGTVDTVQDSPNVYGELIALVRDQQSTIMELSGRLGFLQAELQQRDETIRALMAPQVEPDATEIISVASPVDQGEHATTESVTASPSRWQRLWRRARRAAGERPRGAP